jgi:hypothetical protein
MIVKKLAEIDKFRGWPGRGGRKALLLLQFGEPRPTKPFIALGVDGNSQNIAIKLPCVLIK